MILRRALPLALTLLLAGASAALAANSVTITPPAVATFSDTLNGSDQSATYSMSVPVTYTSNGSNKFATNGWHITATSTTLTGTVTGKTFATTASQFTSISDSAGCTLSNCTDATNSAAITYPLGIPAAATAPSPVTVYTATAGSGIGGNTLTMQVSVAIPANTYADTYTSTLTLAVAEGP